MQKSTENKQAELLATQGNVESNLNKNSPLIEREKIERTPFTLIHEQDKGWYIVMGDYRLTEPVESKIIALDKLQTDKWWLILHLTIIAVTKTEEFKQLSTEQKTKLEEQYNEHLAKK